MKKKFPALLLPCALLVVAFAFATSANAASAVFIKYEGVDGESTDMDHKGWIDLASFSGPVARPGADTGATRRRGDVVLEDIKLVKEVDRASPKLAEAVCKGKVFPKVEIHLTASYSDAGRPNYYAYELTNVRVSSYSVRAPDPGASDAVPQEEIALNFEEIKVTYSKAASKGKAKGKVESSWKVEAGEK
jgi:type VI secretion system secreted protein Hcp